MAVLTTVIPTGDGADDSSKSSFYCWWRSAPEFDAKGHPGPELHPASAGEVPILDPRVRVLREMERLALLGTESLDDARRRLLAYRPGDLWVPTGGMGKQQMEVPAVISVMLVGTKGSGKSSLVNLMYSVLGRSGLIPFAHTSPSAAGKGGGMQCLEEHNVVRTSQSGFCVFDTRGFEYESMPEHLEEMADWIRYGVRHRQACRTAFPSGDSLSLDSRKYARRKVNSVMVVANMYEIYKSYKVGCVKPLDATREIFSATSTLMRGEEPMLVLTHGDQLTTEQRLEARVHICKYLGISETAGSYDIACLNEYGLLVDETDPATAYGVAEAVYRILLLADQNHSPKRGFKDWLLECLYWIMDCVAGFFAALAKFFSQFTNRDHKLKFS